MDNLANLGIFFLGLGIFFVGIGVLYGVSVWDTKNKAEIKTRTESSKDG